jgi:hypothetical protein
MQDNDTIEPLDLDIDLNNVDTTMPIVPAGLRDLRIKSVDKVENKAKDGYNLKVVFETVDPVESLQGKELKPGFPLTRYFSLQPSKKEGSTWDFKVPLAQLLDAAYGTAMGDRPKISKDLEGKVVRAMVKVREEDGVKSNDVDRLTHPNEG